MHLSIRVIGSGILYHRDLVAELCGETNGGFNAGVRNHSDNDEFVNAVLLELEIQIGVGKSTGTPMLAGDNFARPRLKLGTDLTTPRAVFERLIRPTSLLNGRDILPSFVIARKIATMHRIENV